MANRKNSYWDYDAAADIFKCSWPDCDYEHVEPGAVQLHHVRAHLSKQGQKKAAAAAKPGGSSSVSACSHEWRLLSPDDHAEAAAIHAGYGRVCQKCLEVM